jgi:hypothetical protein
MDEETAKLMAEQGIWLSIQPFLDDEDADPFPEGSHQRVKQLQKPFKNFCSRLTPESSLAVMIENPNLWLQSLILHCLSVDKLMKTCE